MQNRIFFSNTQSFITCGELYLMKFTHSSKSKDIYTCNFFTKKIIIKNQAKLMNKHNFKMVNIELVMDQLITINTIWTQ